MNYKMEIKRNDTVQLGDLKEGDCFQIQYDDDTEIHMVMEPQAESNGYVKLPGYCHVIKLRTGLGYMLRKDTNVKPVKLIAKPE